MWLSSGSGAEVEAWSGGPDTSTLLDRATVANAGQFARPAVVQSALGRADIGSVRVRSDDSTASGSTTSRSARWRSPDTEILSGPAAVSRATDASFLFVGNQPETRFDCSLDGAPAVPCRPPYAISGLAPGGHTMTIAMRDRFGTADPTPAVWSWTVDLSPLPAPPQADADGDGVPDARDNCAVGRERVAGRRRRRRRG